MPITHQILDNIYGSIDYIIDLLAGTSRDHLLRVYLNRYKEMGYMESAGDEKHFLDEMSIQKHILDWPKVMFFAAAKKAKKPVKREILKAVRFQGNDGKQYIRFAARFSSENKHGEEIEESYSRIGIWEEPVFTKKYDKQLEDYIETLSVSKTKQHCEYKWPAAIKELSKDFTDKTMFYIEGGGVKYRIHNRQDWEKKTLEELVESERNKGNQDPSKLIGELVETLKKGS
jgi:hypothetical protein